MNIKHAHSTLIKYMHIQKPLEASRIVLKRSSSRRPELPTPENRRLHHPSWFASRSSCFQRHYSQLPRLSPSSITLVNPQTLIASHSLSLMKEFGGRTRSYSSSLIKPMTPAGFWDSQESVGQQLPQLPRTGCDVQGMTARCAHL